MTPTVLHVQNRHPGRRIRDARLRRLAEAALAEPPIAEHAAAPGELGIVLTDAAEMARINADYVGHAGPTDVITFDYREPGRPTASLHGEILICWEVAEAQAREYGTTPALEIVRYLVHGLLHLCGFDDRTPAERRVMKRHEDRLVARLAAAFDCAALIEQAPDQG
jgi:probable rRNA maturation factor